MLKILSTTLLITIVLGGCAPATRQSSSQDQVVTRQEGIQRVDATLRGFAAQYGRRIVDDALVAARELNDDGLLIAHLEVSRAIALRTQARQAVEYAELAQGRIGPRFTPEVQQAIGEMIAKLDNRELTVLWLTTFRELLLRAEGNPLIDSIMQ